MPRFKIYTDTAVMGQTALEEIGRELDSLHSEASQIRKSLRFQIRQRDQIDRNLKRIEKMISCQQDDSVRLAGCLRSAIDTYQKTEQQVVLEYTGDTAYRLIDILKDPAIWYLPIQLPNLLPLILTPGILPIAGAVAAGADLWSKIPDKGSVYHGEVTGEGEFLGVSTSGTISGDVLGYSKSEKAYAEFDMAKGKVGAAVTGTIAGYILQGTAEGNWGILSGEAKAQVGVLEGYGEAKGVLFEDGEFNPELSLKARGRVEGITGEAKGQIGSDDYNVHVQGNGYVGVAKAEAKAVISAEEGVSLKAEAGAAALAGTAKAGFTIGDWNIDFSITGEAGAIGAGAGFSASADSVEIEGKLSALLGLGLKLRISRE